MSILEEIKELPSETKDLRKFGWTMAIAFAVLWAAVAYLFPYLLGHGGNLPILWQIGVGFAVLGTLLPIVLKPVFYIWMGFALALGFVMTRVLLTIFFFVVLTPVALFFRIIGRDALNRKLDPQAASYWIEKEYLIEDRSRFEKFF